MNCRKVRVVFKNLIEIRHWKRQATCKTDILRFLRLIDQLNMDENGDIENERLVLCLARAESYQWQSEGRRAISRNNKILQEI